MNPQQGYSLRFLHSMLDAILSTLRINLTCIDLWMDFESSQDISTECMIKEIKSHVSICNSLRRLAESYLRKLESGRYLSGDAMFQYRETLSKSQGKISEVTKLVIGG